MGTTWEKVESIAAEEGAKFPRLVAAQWMYDLKAKQFESDEDATGWVKDTIIEAQQEVDTLEEAAIAVSTDTHHANTLVQIVMAYVEVLP
jgi:hypothetical protein